MNPVPRAPARADVHAAELDDAADLGTYAPCVPRPHGAARRAILIAGRHGLIKWEEVIEKVG